MLTTHIQELVPQCMLFAYSIVLVGELKEEINGKLEKWRESLEALGVRLSKIKIMYIECKFNKRHVDANLEVKIENHIIPQVMWFRYFGSIIETIP